jgi:hypothetical protein
MPLTAEPLARKRYRLGHVEISDIVLIYHAT